MDQKQYTLFPKGEKKLIELEIGLRSAGGQRRRRRKPSEQRSSSIQGKPREEDCMKTLNWRYALRPIQRERRPSISRQPKLTFGSNFAFSDKSEVVDICPVTSVHDIMLSQATGLPSRIDEKHLNAHFFQRNISYLQLTVSMMVHYTKLNLVQEEMSVIELQPFRRHSITFRELAMVMINTLNNYIPYRKRKVMGALHLKKGSKESLVTFREFFMLQNARLRKNLRVIFHQPSSVLEIRFISDYRRETSKIGTTVLSEALP